MSVGGICVNDVSERTYHHVIGLILKAGLLHQAIVRIGQSFIPDAEIPQFAKGGKLADKPIIDQQLAGAEEVCVAGHFLRSVRSSLEILERRMLYLGGKSRF